MKFQVDTSLRRRLPLLIIALLAGIGFTFSWMAYREMEAALRAQGNERVRSAATYLANLLGQSAATRVADSRRLATDPAVQRFVHSGEDLEDAAGVLRTYLSRNPQSTVTLFGPGGTLLGRMDRTMSAFAPGMDQNGGSQAVDLDTISGLRQRSGQIYYSTTASIPAAPAAAAVAPGWLTIERPLASPAMAKLLESLIGTGALLKVGNAAGDIWTDLAAPVDAPPGPVPADDAIRYVGQDGSSRLGNAVAVPGVPWLVWVELEEASLLAPARSLLRRMLPATLVLVALGAFAVRAVSGRITAPIERLADAADAIAAGDYSRRVEVARRDEVGRLASAFNLMSARVSESRDTLEDRVRARTVELEHAREELDQFFSLSLDLLCIADMDGRFKRVNPAWEQALGWTAADLTAAPYLDRVHPDDFEATAHEAAKLSEGGRTVSFENRYRCKDGSYRWLSWKAAPHPGRGLIYAAAHDVTEQKRAAQELEQQAAELANANRELEAFSYSVSHDLRAPLRSIDGFGQALVEDYADRLDDTGLDFLSRIRNAAQRMGLLIDDLLALSRVSRQELVSTSVDLSALVTDVASRLGEQAPGRRVEWRIQPDLKAYGDPRLLRVALQNLLENAWKFTSKLDAARIEFLAETLPGGGLTYIVRDNGAGFDMEYAGKLFGAFQRLHGVADFPGTGIGLATVQRIVRRHGGRIRAEAAVGRGATFSFTLGSEPAP